jgi:hypothetical protein
VKLCNAIPLSLLNFCNERLLLHTLACIKQKFYIALTSIYLSNFCYRLIFYNKSLTMLCKTFVIFVCAPAKVSQCYAKLLLLQNFCYCKTFVTAKLLLLQNFCHCKTFVYRCRTCIFSGKSLTRQKRQSPGWLGQGCPLNRRSVPFGTTTFGCFGGT